MHGYTVVFGSITYAMKGKSLLEKNGIRSTMERNLDYMEKYGCGYSLRVKADIATVEALLQKHRVKYLAVIAPGDAL